MEAIRDNVIAGNKAEAEAKVREALDANIPPDEILNEGLIAAMNEVGARFERRQLFVPEMLIAGRAMKAGLTILKPYLAQEGVQLAGKVVIGTVEGDLHDIGKNLVAMMLEGAGFEIINLGADVSPEKFTAAVRQHNPNIVGMSALLTTTMRNMEAVITALQEVGLRDRVKVIVGGAPVTEAFAKEIGADGYASDASRAATLVKSLV